MNTNDNRPVNVPELVRNDDRRAIFRNFEACGLLNGCSAVRAIRWNSSHNINEIEANFVHLSLTMLKSSVFQTLSALSSVTVTRYSPSSPHTSAEMTGPSLRSARSAVEQSDRPVLLTLISQIFTIRTRISRTRFQRRIYVHQLLLRLFWIPGRGGGCMVDALRAHEAVERTSTIRIA